MKWKTDESTCVTGPSACQCSCSPLRRVIVKKLQAFPARSYGSCAAAAEQDWASRGQRAGRRTHADTHPYLMSQIPSDRHMIHHSSPFLLTDAKVYFYRQISVQGNNKQLNRFLKKKCTSHPKRTPSVTSPVTKINQWRGIGGWKGALIVPERPENCWGRGLAFLLEASWGRPRFCWQRPSANVWPPVTRRRTNARTL